MGGRGAWWQREIVHIHYDRIGLGRRRSGTGTAAESRWHCNLTGMFPNHGNKAARHEWRMPSVLKEINCELEGNVVHTVIEYYWSVEHERPGSSHAKQASGAEVWWLRKAKEQLPDHERTQLGWEARWKKDICDCASVCTCAANPTPECALPDTPALSKLHDIINNYNC